MAKRNKRPTQLQLAAFGADVLEVLREAICELGAYELDAEALVDVAVKHGLASRPNYDPEIHGDCHWLVDSEVGDPIIWFGE